jgi:hypothetical protein
MEYMIIISVNGHVVEHPGTLRESSTIPRNTSVAESGRVFDPGEAMLRTRAESPLVGADRIVWLSEIPHPDANLPEVTEKLAEAWAGLSLEQKRQITTESVVAFYGRAGLAHAHKGVHSNG